MIRSLLLVALALFAPAALSAPWLACDLDPRATHSAVRFCATFAADGKTCATWGAWSADAPAFVNGAAKECRHDLAAVPAGKLQTQVKAIDVAGWGGREESPPSDPFDFTRPPAMGKPVSSRVVP
jgi:hypothetical protein